MRRDRTLVTPGRDLPPTQPRERVDDQAHHSICPCPVGHARGLTPPSWTPATQYEVIADGQIVGRISLVGALQNKPWMWSIDFTFSEGHEPLYGFEATREAAMQSFAKSWFRN